MIYRIEQNLQNRVALNEKIFAVNITKNRLEFKMNKILPYIRDGQYYTKFDKI